MGREDGFVNAGKVADSQAKDPFLLGPSTLVEETNNGPVDGQIHCNKTAESPAMAEAEFSLKMDEKEPATSEEVDTPTQTSAVAAEAASMANVAKIGTSAQVQ